jgi:tRNA (guanine-N7-)-methyltransferase
MTLAQSYKLKEVPTLLPHNVDWATLFHNKNPIDLEIGCGRPHFLFDRAVNYPERNIVGVEWKYEMVAMGHRRILRDKISNAALFHGNAWGLVPMLFARRTISYIFVNFPDPWWKARHKKRLVLNDVFLSALAERSLSGGGIFLQTDVEELFEYYKSIINSHGSFVYDDKISYDNIIHALKAQTHREKKCIEYGLPVYRGFFALTKGSKPAS